MNREKTYDERTPIADDTPIEELVYRRDLATLSAEDQIKAMARVDEVKALLELGSERTEAHVIAAAKRLGLSRTWVYKLMKRYHSGGALSAMLGEKRGVRPGSTRIDPAVEKIIWDAINKFYLTRKKNRAFYIIREVHAKCDEYGLKRPAKGTIRKRIKSVPARKADAAREGGHYARDKYSQVFEGFPMPKFPLSIVQIDHSPLDIQLLSEDQRLPIGKAYLTIAIDVYSRAILGFVVTLQAPSALSVGLCLQMVIEPKTDWLRQRKLDLNFPMWGKPDRIHVDNGSDFRCNGLKLGCYENGITLEHRPIRHPSTGGIIERVIGTVQKEIHQFEGSTFSNTQQKKNYDPEKDAIFTLPEVEAIIATFITQQYHEDVHQGIGRVPRAAWDAGLFGEGDKPFRGLPKRMPDARKFLIDILPVKFKSVQRYGFQWDYIRYNHDKLRMIINSGDKTEFVIRRDPRDLSKIFMLYTGNGKTEYWEIPYANLSREKITLEDHKAARAYLNQRNATEINEDMIFKAHRKIQEIAAKAKVETKKARRQRAKKKYASISSVRAPTSAPVVERKQLPTKPSSKIKRKPLSDDFDDIDLME